jgi:RNA polymerase sigma factor (sigma-70 family)
VDEILVSAPPAGLVRETPEERVGRLFNAHHQRLYRLALRLAGAREDARDLVQETFLRAARRPAAVPASEPGGEAWLVRVLVNLCRDRYRRQAVRERARAWLRPGPAVTASHEPAALAADQVRAALARLSPRRRAVVVMAELEELGNGDIARLLGITQAAVRWHRAQARRALARILMETR